MLIYAGDRPFKMTKLHHHWVQFLPMIYSRFLPHVHCSCRYLHTAVGAQKETPVFCDSFFIRKRKKKRKTSREDGLFHSALLNGVSLVIIGSFSMCALFMKKKTHSFPRNIRPGLLFEQHSAWLFDRLRCPLLSYSSKLIRGKVD